MSSDNSDKTVFRQPAQPAGGNQADHTILRPTPGGRGSQTQQNTPPPQNYHNNPPAYQQIRSTPQHYAAGVDAQSTVFHTTYGLNPLVNAASTLIAVFQKTHNSVSHPNVGGLHQRLVNEIKKFETQAKERGIKPEIILSARYVLCTVLDEAVLNTPWGAESAWPQRTLLSMFHNETSGGEKFFLIMDRMRDRPAENRDILELMYIFLSLGYEGKYRVIHRGRETLEQIRDELFRIIRNNRGEYERELSPSWHGLGKIRNSLAQYVPIWVVASIVGVLMLISYSGFRYWLYHSSSPVAHELTEISKNVTQSDSRNRRINTVN